MKAWFVTKLGEPNEVLVLNDVPRPVPNPDEVLIRVEAFALNFFDILLCQGKYQEKPPIPFTPGAEIAGVIEEVGAGATLKKGTRVLATPHLPFGGYSQYVVVPENDVYVIPEDMSFEKAAALFITYQTAYYALKFKGMLTAGETLLVHAGSGGVGSAAIQIGKALGANVIATAGTNEN